MTAAGKMPDFTLVFHDAETPVQEVLQALHDGFRDRLKFIYHPVRYGDPASTDALVLRIEVMVMNEHDEPREIETTACEARRRAHCELMDRLHVPNGCKAIAIALHEHWTAAMFERFGEPASPSSVKRWRADQQQRRGSWRGDRAQARQKAWGETLERRVRVHHAIRVGAAGLTKRQGYRDALDDLAAIREEHDKKQGTTFSLSPPFSYSTFRRECEKITPCQRRATARRGR